MTRPSILTREALDHILNTYANHGGAEARALAPVYGIQPSYVKKLASIHGVKVRLKYARKRVHFAAPRWQWARQRGSVVA